MAKKKQLTNLQQQFQKERKRLQQFVRRANKRGYEFPDDIVPVMPKRVTKKRLEQIKNTKPATLYNKAIWVDHSTGEVLEGTQAVKLEQQAKAYKASQTRKQRESKKKKPVEVTPEPVETPVAPPPRPKEPVRQGGTPLLPSFSDIVIQNFKADMARFPEVAYPIFMRWLADLEKMYDKDTIADMLEQSKQNGLFPDYSVAYRKDLVLSAIGDMMEYLDASEGMKQEITDALEYDEDWELPE